MNKIFSLLVIIIFNISTIKNNSISFQSNLYKIIHEFTNNKLQSLTLYNYKKGKICISPLSIYQILSLVSNGANKQTISRFFIKEIIICISVIRILPILITYVLFWLLSVYTPYLYFFILFLKGIILFIRCLHYILILTNKWKWSSFFSSSIMII